MEPDHRSVAEKCRPPTTVRLKRQRYRDVPPSRTFVTEATRTVNADQRFPRKKPYSSIVIDSVSRAGQVRRSQHCRGHRDRHASVHSSKSRLFHDLRSWYHHPRYMRPSVRHFLVASHVTSRIHVRLVGLSTATAKQQHRPRSTKLGAPSLWEVSIDPMDTPEGRAPIPGGPGGNRDESLYIHKVGRKPRRFRGSKGLRVPFLPLFFDCTKTSGTHT